MRHSRLGAIGEALVLRALRVRKRVAGRLPGAGLSWIVAALLVVTQLIGSVPPMARAGTGTAPDGIGNRKAYKFEAQLLNDRLDVKVNVSNGNLLVEATDLEIVGIGLGLSVERFYNSLSTWNESMGPGWLLGVGHDVRLELSAAAAVFHAPSGYQARFNQNADGTYSALPDPGIDAALTKKADGTFELKWHSKEKYLFNSSGRWTEHRDKNDNFIRFAYSTGNNPVVTTITDTRGRTVSFGYKSGRVITVTDNAAGRTYTYTYDASGRLASSAVTAYALARDTVNVGVKTLFGYDTSGRLTRITDPRGNATTFTYDGTSRKLKTITRVTDPNTGTGPTTTFTYLTSLDKCAGEQGAVRETKVDGPRIDVADITTHCLDTHDRAVAVFDAKGQKRSSTYASNSNVADLNESGVATGPMFGFGWSTDNQLVSVSLPTGGKASLEYQDVGNLHVPTSVRDFSTGSATAPATWAYDYDDDGNLIEANNATEGITYRYCYNGNGTVDRTAPPPLDALPLDENTSASACAGQPQGNDTLFTYNARGELIRVDPPGPRGTVELTYDAVSRVATRTDARGIRMTFSYDALDRITRIDYEQSVAPAGGSGAVGTSAVEIPPDDDTATHVWINYSYDVNGNLTARSDSNGNATFQYDALNRMTKEAPEAPSASTTYSYDPAGNPTVVQATDEPAAVRYSYDSTNLVGSIVDQEGRTTTFTYNKKGLRRKTSYANGVVMENRYDDSNRLTCIYAYTGTPPATDPSNEESCPSPPTSLLSYYRYSYEALVGGANTDTDRREKTIERDGSVTTYGYDAISRLTKASTTDTAGAVTRDHSYTYDAESNLTREQVTGTSATSETRTQAYDLDAALCWTASGDHPANCQTAPTGATSYSYTADGSLQSTSAGLAATYSLRGHMVEITPPGGAAIAMKYTDATQDRRILASDLRIAYNQLGLSSQAPTNAASNATWFVRDPHGELVGMLAADPAVPDLYYLFDGLGSVVATTDGAGNLVRRYVYEPYGEEIGPSSSDRNPWRYASGYQDIATGMLKYGTRYYMPNLTRWTQQDPVRGELTDPLQLNPYLYAGSDPINFIDPDGAFRWRRVGQVLIGGVAVLGGRMLIVHSLHAGGLCLAATRGVGSVLCIKAAALGVASGVTLIALGGEMICRGVKGKQRCWRPKGAR